MKKNVASQAVGVQMVSASDGSAFTGAVTVYITGDAGTQAVGSVGSGACTHEGNGFHTYAPAQAETNYNHVAFTFIGTGAVPATVQIYTSFPQTGDAYAETTNGTYGLSAIETTLGTPAGASIAADLVVIDNFVDGIETTLGAAGAGLTGVASIVWSDTLTTYTAGMAGKRLKGITAIPVIEGTINDAAATTTSFITTLTGYGTNFFVDALCLIEYAADKWQANVVTTYNTTTGAMTFVEAFYAAPSNGLNIALSMTHIHPISQIQAGLALEATAQSILTDTAEIGVAGAGLTALATQTSVNTIDDFLDTEVAAIKAKTDQLVFTKANELDSNVQSINGVTIVGDGSATPFNV